MQYRIIFVHLFYLIDKLSGADKYGGADTEYAGSTGYCQDAAQTVFVIKTEADQQHHCCERSYIGCPCSLDVCISHSTFDVVAGEKDAECKNDSPHIGIEIELCEKITSHTCQPTWFFQIGGKIIP